MANVKTYSVASQGNLQLSDNFIVKEFACHDGSDEVLIDLELVDLLQKLRDALKAPILITSGYRTPRYNALPSVGGAPNSLHTKGRAADIVAFGKTTAETAACAESVGALGILRYVDDGHIHIDTREKKYFAEYRGSGVTVVRSFLRASGSAISDIQRTMNRRYQTELAEDGIFGGRTKQALIKGLQTEINKYLVSGIPVDGYWGPKTKANCPVVGGGSGAVPYIIQAGLYCIAGFTALAVDGIYGAATIAAVRAFQSRKGLAEDGITGPDTFEALFG